MSQDSGNEGIRSETEPELTLLPLCSLFYSLNGGIFIHSGEQGSSSSGYHSNADSSKGSSQLPLGNTLFPEVWLVLARLSCQVTIAIREEA